jgi:hypothetical protein
MTQIERRLWNYLSPRKKAEVANFLNALEDDQSSPQTTMPDSSSREFYDIAPERGKENAQ